MRRLLLAPILVLACGIVDAPPGEAIGTFAFVATLDTSDAEGRCRFSGAPEEIRFEGALSHLPESNEAWMAVDGSLRQGTIEGARFELGLPEESDGSVRAVPRRLDACSCDLAFIEHIAGRLARSVESCTGESQPVEPGIEGCPRIEAGELRWDTCGGVCGTLREEVRFPAQSACTCEVDGAPESMGGSCEFVYELRGTRVGG